MPLVGGGLLLWPPVRHLRGRGGAACVSNGGGSGARACEQRGADELLGAGPCWPGVSQRPAMARRGSAPLLATAQQHNEQRHLHCSTSAHLLGTLELCTGSRCRGRIRAVSNIVFAGRSYPRPRPGRRRLPPPGTRLHRSGGLGGRPGPCHAAAGCSAPRNAPHAGQRVLTGMGGRGGDLPPRLQRHTGGGERHGKHGWLAGRLSAGAPQAA